jgi:hypothetical protein
MATDERDDARKYAQEQCRVMRDTSLTFQKRLNAAQRACAYWNRAGSDEGLWRILGERLALGLVRRDSVNFGYIVKMVRDLAGRSTPPSGCKHVAAAYLGETAKPAKSRKSREK